MKICFKLQVLLNSNNESKIWIQTNSIFMLWVNGNESITYTKTKTSYKTNCMHIKLLTTKSIFFFMLQCYRPVNLFKGFFPVQNMVLLKLKKLWSKLEYHKFI